MRKQIKFYGKWAVCDGSMASVNERYFYSGLKSRLISLLDNITDCVSINKIFVQNGWNDKTVVIFAFEENWSG